MADNFTLLFVGFITAVVLLSIFIAVKRRMPVKERSPYCYSSALRYSTKVIFRPASGFWDMKKEHYGRTSAAITILAVTTVLYAVFNSTKGFIFTSGVTEGNFFLGLLTVIAPFFLFTICNWCVSNLMGGEGSYRYIFMGTSYALTPMVIILPVLMILSHVMTGEESGIYYLITGIMLIWTVILIVCANMEVHAYRMGKTLLVMFITIIVMIIIVFLIAFIAALAQQIIGVAGDMINEIYLRL